MRIFRYPLIPNLRTVCVASIIIVVFVYSVLCQKQPSIFPLIEEPLIKQRQTSQLPTTRIVPVASVASQKPIFQQTIISNEQTSEVNDTDNILIDKNIEWFAGMDLPLLMKDSALNKHTLNIAHTFQVKFHVNVDDLDLHVRHVENDLILAGVNDHSVEEFTHFYRQFVAFENIQANEPHPLWLEEPVTIDDAIDLNQAMQQYRREVFGNTVADEVWGHELKVYEYKLAAMQIVRDEDYGEGMVIKDQVLADLHKQTWQGELSSEENLKTKFHIKLASHGESLLSMLDKKRREKIAELRFEIYGADGSGM